MKSHLILLLPICLGIAHLTNAQAVCRDNESCVGLAECPGLNSVARLIRATRARAKRLQMLGVIKDRLCGQLDADLRVCCDLSSGRRYRLRPLTFHSLEGEVELVDAKHVRIHDFVHDGTGPDAFFIVGTNTDSPNARDAIPVPFPAINNNNEQLLFTNKAIPVINKPFTGKTITLKLPGDITTDQIRWLSLFCRDFDTDFGHVIF